MNVRALVVGGFAFGALLALAPSARADGFYVSFSGGTVPLGGRLVGGALDASSSSTTDLATGQTSGAHTRQPLKIELDDWDNLEGMINAVATNTTLSAVVEFTAPDANGHEQVYMNATYKDLAFTRLDVTYDAAATPKAKQVLEFTYSQVTYGTPATTATPTTPTAGTRLAVPTQLVRTMPTRVPTITRPMTTVSRLKMSTAVTSLRIDDAYMQGTNLTGESTDHPGQTRVLNVEAEILAPRDIATGQASGKRQYKPILLTKAMGLSTPQLQQHQAANQAISALTLTFVQKTPNQPDKTAHTIALTNALISTNTTLVANGTSAQKLGFNYQKVSVSAGATSVSAAP
jgi:type VI secretion system Hcp family effector